MEKDAVELNDFKARLIGIPLGGLLMTFIYTGNQLTGLNLVFFQQWLQSTAITFVFWQGNRAIFCYLRRQFPQYHQTRTRLIYQVVISVFFTFIATWITRSVLRALGQPCDVGNIFESFFINIIPTFIVCLIYESVFFFESWQANVKKTEALARENVQSQLETLKNQLDPHFLFNSLNTLASLIDDHNVPAQEYLDRLSDVYRYVLVSRERNTVTLEEEMAFLDAYIYLNKVRFRENLLIEKQIQPEVYSQQVAPLSLQMLVENAIKHNVVSKEKPLTIRISQGAYGYLTVENNIQEKVIFEKSTKVGLQNIINRYKLLTDRQVEIDTNPDFFTVHIPLLQTS